MAGERKLPMMMDGGEWNILIAVDADLPDGAKAFTATGRPTDTKAAAVKRRSTWPLRAVLPVRVVQVAVVLSVVILGNDLSMVR